MTSISNSNSGNHRGKVLEIEDLAAVLAPVRASGKKVVLCHGVFDLLHIGHIRHFEQAKRMGDVLVVTTTPDRYVNKGPNRPAFSEELRAEGVAALACVDHVAINKWPLAVEAIRLLRPDYFVKGSDYQDPEGDRTGGISLEESAVKEVGGQIAFTDDITFSASNLINRHISVYPKEVNDYLANFSGKYSAEEVIGYLESARSLKVLVVGETIIDEYLYCETMGKTGKEPVLAARAIHGEKFAGGIVAVANHVSAFAGQVSMLTALGGAQPQEEFIRENLASAIQPHFQYLNGDAPTIVKRRFVESYPFRTLFEIYEIDGNEHRPDESREFCAKLKEELPKYDAVIVADYGHGLLGPEEIDVLCNHAQFLAVNTQANAGNRGYNTISKYGRADFICVSENEIRLEARNRRGDLRDIVSDVAPKLSCDRVIVTRGKTGSLCYSAQDGFFELPALAVQVVDRIGAGDAVFSIASLCVAQGTPMEVVGFIGNAVGAEAVATVGHRGSTERVPLYRHIETLLK